MGSVPPIPPSPNIPPAPPNSPPYPPDRAPKPPPESPPKPPPNSPSPETPPEYITDFTEEELLYFFTKVIVAQT